MEDSFSSMAAQPAQNGRKKDLLFTAGKNARKE
jgi:hypothetical protein